MLPTHHLEPEVGWRQTSVSRLNRLWYRLPTYEGPDIPGRSDPLSRRDLPTHICEPHARGREISTTRSVLQTDLWYRRSGPTDTTRRPKGRGTLTL